MKYRLLDGNEERHIDLADGATPADLRFMVNHIRKNVDPDFWASWRVVEYTQGEEVWLDAWSIVHAP